MIALPPLASAQQTDPPLTFLKQPDDVKQEVGKTVTFSVSVTRTDAPAFQWFKNQAEIPGAVSPSYTTPPVRLSDHGAKFKVKVTSGTNSVESREAVLTVVAATREVVKGFLKAEVFTGIPGTSLESDLRSHPKYLENRPDATEFLTMFEFPAATATQPPSTNTFDDYGVRITGFIVPQQSARYIFYLASDGPGELYLSHNENPAGQVLIASEPNANPARAFANIEGRPGCPDACENVSAPIPLEAGKRYAIRAEMKESTGADHLAVTWIVDGDPMPTNGATPIQSSFLATEANPNLAPEIQITQQPQNIMVSENGVATFTVAATSSTTVAVQWQRAAAGTTNFVDIAGANAATFTTPPLVSSQSGTRFRAVLSVPGRSVLSGEALVTVQGDPNAARIDSIKVQGNTVTITWSGGGILQTANDVTGPWTDVTAATSPFSTNLTGIRKFFRLRK